MLALNDWLDGIPRSEIRLGRWLIPPYFAFGMIGLVTATLWVILLSLVFRADLLLHLAAIPIACLAFVVVAFVRRRLFGAESYVLLEYFAAVVVTWASTLWLMGQLILPTLDVLVSGLCVFLAWGRVGCLVGGCCYGPPFRVGIAYPEECGHDPNVRRLPVQLAEVLLWTALALVSAVFTWGWPPGTGVVSVFVSYGVARVFLETVRGDPRPSWRGISAGQVWGSGFAAVGVALWCQLVPPTETSLGAAGVAAVVALMLLATRSRWLAALRTPDGEVKQALVEAGQAIATEPLGPEVRTRDVAGVSVGASWLQREGVDVVVLSLTRPGKPLSLAEAELLFLSLLAGMGLDAAQVTPLRRPRGVYYLELIGLRPAKTLPAWAQP